MHQRLARSLKASGFRQTRTPQAMVTSLVGMVSTMRKALLGIFHRSSCSAVLITVSVLPSSQSAMDVGSIARLESQCRHGGVYVDSTIITLFGDGEGSRNSHSPWTRTNSAANSSRASPSMISTVEAGYGARAWAG
jgi:hypothetical protein